MIIEAIITAIIVSIDGFFSGFAIGIKKTKINFKKLILISIIPIIMAFPIMLIGYYISNKIEINQANYIGSILFLLLAINAIKQINKQQEQNSTINITNSLILGISIGIDSSISAFTLAIHHHNPIITPLYFGISHAILIHLGNTLSLKTKTKKISNIEYLSPLLFTIIAISKLL